jgi:hypothetical protein
MADVSGFFSLVWCYLYHMNLVSTCWGNHVYVSVHVDILSLTLLDAVQ